MADAETKPDQCECDGSGWVDCWACWGEGDYHDCGEDSCCCAEPEIDEMWPCEECQGEGGWPCHCGAGDD